MKNLMLVLLLVQEDKEVMKDKKLKKNLMKKWLEN